MRSSRTGKSQKDVVFAEAVSWHLFSLYSLDLVDKKLQKSKNGFLEKKFPPLKWRFGFKKIQKGSSCLFKTASESFNFFSSRQMEDNFFWKQRLRRSTSLSGWDSNPNKSLICLKIILKSFFFNFFFWKRMIRRQKLSRTVEVLMTGSGNKFLKSFGETFVKDYCWLEHICWRCFSG